MGNNLTADKRRLTQMNRELFFRGQMLKGWVGFFCYN